MNPQNSRPKRTPHSQQVPYNTPPNHHPFNPLLQVPPPNFANHIPPQPLMNPPLPNLQTPIPFHHPTTPIRSPPMRPPPHMPFDTMRPPPHMPFGAMRPPPHMPFGAMRPPPHMPFGAMRPPAATSDPTSTSGKKIPTQLSELVRQLYNCVNQL
jgi:Wiskott-Aldrich syndrome protein